MDEATIGSNEALARVGADEHSSTVGRDYDLVGVTRIDHDVIDDDVGSSYAFPGLAGIDGLPQSLRSSRIHQVRVCRILLQDTGAPGRKRHSLHLVKELTPILALVDA